MLAVHMQKISQPETTKCLWEMLNEFLIEQLIKANVLHNFPYTTCVE